MLRALWLSGFISLPSPTTVPGLAQTHLAGSCDPGIPRCQGQGRGDGRAPGTPPVCGCPHAAPRSPPWLAVPRCALTAAAQGSEVCSLPVDSHCLERLAGAESAPRLLLMEEERQQRYAGASSHLKCLLEQPSAVTLLWIRSARCFTEFKRQHVTKGTPKYCLLN